MMELCCTQYWSDLSDAIVSLKVTFHSLHPDTSTLKLVGVIEILVYTYSTCCFILSTVGTPGLGWM